MRGIVVPILNLAPSLIRREIEARYRGSIFGVLWSFLTPLMMIAVFTFVFAVVFQARWGSGSTSKTEFALIIFAGLTAFNLFGEVFARAPSLVVAQPNLVKKVVFPLEVLVPVALGAALFQTCIAFAALLVFQVLIGSGLHLTALAVPILVAPLALFTLGIGWFLAALGVYVRDVAQIVPPITTALMFLTPVFYPTSALPEFIRPLAAYNPLGASIEQVREAVIFGRLPDPAAWLVGLAGSLAVAGLGYAFFQKTRKGFADVL
jgi:lipopolysaccharide transport system permease protein